MSLYHLMKRTAKIGIACYLTYELARGCNAIVFGGVDPQQHYQNTILYEQQHGQREQVRTLREGPLR